MLKQELEEIKMERDIISWRNKKNQRETEVNEYKEVIREIFRDSQGTYGVNRICGDLRKHVKPSLLY